MFDAEPSRKSRSEKLLRRARKHRCLGGRLVILAFMIGMGYSLLGEKGIAAPMGPSASEAEWASIFYYEASTGQNTKERTRKPPGSETTCDDLSVLVDHSHSLPSDYVPKHLVPLQDYRVPTLGSEVLRLRREAAETYMTYCGRYEFHADTVVHHVKLSLFPNSLRGID